MSATTTSDTVVSADGTRIGFDSAGSGPVVVLVASALADRSDAAPLAALLAKRFTVVNYDRRGRGQSGDTAPYAVRREVEDLASLIDAHGGSARLFGVSSGAVLALEAAAGLPSKVAGAVLYEPPFIVDDGRAPVPADYGTRVASLAAGGRAGDAVELFMTAALGIPAEYVGGMRQDPSWATMEALAPTLAYDAAIMGGNQAGRPLVTERWAAATAPVLVLTGGASEPFVARAAEQLVAGLPNARHQPLPGQDHSAVMAAPDVVAAAISVAFGS